MSRNYTNDDYPHTDDMAEDDDVGYRKPPRKHRFRPGASGNPAGRRKGSRNRTSVLQDLFDQKVRITEKGKEKSVTFLEAFMKGLARDAIQGSMKDRLAFMREAAKHAPQLFEIPKEEMVQRIVIQHVESDGNGRLAPVHVAADKARARRVETRNAIREAREAAAREKRLARKAAKEAREATAKEAVGTPGVPEEKARAVDDDDSWLDGKS